MLSEDKYSCACCNDTMYQYNKIKDGIVFKCKSCKSMKLLKEGSLPTSEYGSSYKNHLDKNKAVQLYGFFTSLFPQRHDDKYSLLDIGCGDGSFMEIVQRNGWNAYGIDSDKSTIEMTRKRNLACDVGILGEKLNLDNKYDIVTLWDIIEHVDDVHTAVSSINDFISSKGKLVVLTPDADSLIDTFAKIEKLLTFGKSQRLNNLCLNRYHLHRFTKQGLTELLENNGFRIKMVKPVHLFSLESGSYFNDFAPGIDRLTDSNSLNKTISKIGYRFLRMFRIRNKLLCVAEYNGKQ